MRHWDEKGQFGIQQVSTITGLSKQVIRKWEERYGIVRPQRLENGYRVYRQQDIKTLLKVKKLSKQGYSLKEAALLVQEAGEEPLPPLPKRETAAYDKWDGYIFELLEKGSRCDEVGLNLILKQTYHQLGLERFLNQVAVPFLKEVGRKWESKEWNEYQEAVSSMVLRDFLVQIRRNYPYREGAPFVLGACLPYEQHEVPVHLILLRFMMAGWKTQLVGTSPAPGAIESLVSTLKPDVVLLSATTTIPFEADPQLLERLDEFAAKHPESRFYLGGQGALSYPFDEGPKHIRVTDSLEEILR